jgi:hypothetical protein
MGSAEATEKAVEERRTAVIMPFRFMFKDLLKPLIKVKNLAVSVCLRCAIFKGKLGLQLLFSWGLMAPAYAGHGF